VCGEVQHYFDDVLICGSHGLPNDLVAALEPWDLQTLTPFQSEYLSGFKTERYAIGLEEGVGCAKTVMEKTIRRLVHQDIGGDHQRIVSLETRYLGVTFKHLLLPIWLATYRYHDKLYQILINARTGEVQGRRPYSVWKITLAVISLLIVVGVVVYLVNR
jgi:hypothetical protein